MMATKNGHVYPNPRYVEIIDCFGTPIFRGTITADPNVDWRTIGIPVERFIDMNVKNEYPLETANPMLPYKLRIHTAKPDNFDWK